MKKLIRFLIISAVLCLSACEQYYTIVDTLKDHETRILKLEEWCRQMNTNISSLQSIISALQNQDYITGVAPVVQEGQTVGYTITFAKAQPITVYHGKDGSSSGDVYIPKIGVQKDSDGIWYWTIDGNWLLDENGQKVKAVGTDGTDGSDGADGEDGAPGAPGQDGVPGQDGAPGQDGKDGVTPQLKIENGRWLVSYDNGKTWTDLGQATGEQGPQGTPGVGGDSMFTNVDYSTSKDYIIFHLNNGVQIKVPTWSAFEALQTLVNQMNTNISSLQTIVTALQNNDYVTSVTPLYEGSVEIGYVINFAKGGKVTIYHGKDGADGAPGADGEDGADGSDGADGKAPVIGVKKDTDGVYYWTVDGQWLLDENGQKVKAVGTDGASGSDGAPGAAGKDGVTPQLKIENGRWLVSYDKGKTWNDLGQATGEQGTPGVGGDSMFSNVTYNSTSVTFVLSDGTQISVPLISNGVSVNLKSVGETSAQFEGTVAQKCVDFRVTVYYSTASDLTLHNYQGKASVTSVSGSSFTLTVNPLQPEKKYYYFVETVNNGKTAYSEVKSFTTTEVAGYNSQFSVSGATDLSAAGTANSYIVTKAGTYRISPVKGNGTVSVGTVSSVVVLWESFGTATTPDKGSLVESVKYEGGYIYFKTNGTYKEGNAVIAAKNAAGTILWSWHIWMTDQPKEQAYKNNAGTMMDRNLGATSAVPGEVGALGLMYQWGRKDPFMGSSDISSPVEAKATVAFPMAVNSTSESGTVAYATENPTTMIKGEKTNNWMYSVDKTLWASSKTIYDPCPAGWRIPDAGENGVWQKAIGAVQVSTNPFDKNNKGVNLSGLAGSDSNIWYPATGYYGKADGKFYGTGTSASYHSVTPAKTYGTISFAFGANHPDLYLDNMTDFGGAAPARCIKE